MDSISIRGLCGVYAAMLYAYPRDFHRQYGAPMRQVFREALKDRVVPPATSGTRPQRVPQAASAREV